MSRKNFDIFININSEKIVIAIFKKNDEDCVFYKESDCLTNLATDKLNFLDTEKILEENIIEAEKITGQKLQLSANPKAEIITVLREQYGLID